MSKKKSIWALLAIIMVVTLSVGFVSCSSDDDDELKVETQLMIVMKNTKGERLSGQCFIFPDGDYDEKSFIHSSIGSIKTTAGKSVTSIAFGSISSKQSLTHECSPGRYYVVGVYMGKQTWSNIPYKECKGQYVFAEKNKITTVEIVIHN